MIDWPQRFQHLHLAFAFAAVDVAPAIELDA